jgi:hypothetical protein
MLRSWSQDTDVGWAGNSDLVHDEDIGSRNCDQLNRVSGLDVFQSAKEPVPVSGDADVAPLSWK